MFTIIVWDPSKKIEELIECTHTVWDKEKGLSVVRSDGTNILYPIDKDEKDIKSISVLNNSNHLIKSYNV